MNVVMAVIVVMVLVVVEIEGGGVCQVGCLSKYTCKSYAGITLHYHKGIAGSCKVASLPSHRTSCTGSGGRAALHYISAACADYGYRYRYVKYV